jgi:chemotaxis response regulator CheB
MVVMLLRRSGTSLSAVKVLQTAGDIEVVDEAGDGRQAVELALRLLPDVVFCGHPDVAATWWTK